MAITAQFTADFSQFNAAASDAKGNLENVAAAAEGMAIDRQAERAGAALGTLAKTVGSFAQDYVDAFAEEQKATQSLTTALENQGNTTVPATVAAYKTMGEEFQRMTRFSDDAVTKAQTAFIQIGKIGPDQMQPAIQAAADLAAQLGIGLPEAAQKIATVIGTDGAKLGSLKGMLGDVDLKGQGAAKILQTIHERVGGAAAADMDTYAGKAANLGNQFDDMKGKLGDAVAKVITPLLDAFLQLPEPMQKTLTVVGLLGAAAVPIAAAFSAVVLAVTPLIPLLGAGGLAGAFALLAPFLLPAGVILAGITGIYLAFKNWDKITAFVKGVYDGIKTWLVDGFKALVDQILAPIRLVEGGFKWLYDKVVGGSWVPDLIAGIDEEFSKLNQVMVEPATKAADATEKALGGAMTAIGEMAGGALAGFAKGGGESGGVQLPGSRIEAAGGQSYLISPEGYRVPMEKTATGNSVMPANWWAMYTGRESSPLNSMFTGTEFATAANNRPPPVNITINGSVLSTQDQMSTMVQDAMMQAYRQGGNLLPV